MGDYDLRADLAALTMPALSFIAEIPFGAAAGEELADALPQGTSRWIVMRGCGHLPWLECPDWFLGEVRAFLWPRSERAATNRV